MQKHCIAVREKIFKKNIKRVQWFCIGELLYLRNIFFKTELASYDKQNFQ